MAIKIEIKNTYAQFIKITIFTLAIVFVLTLFLRIKDSHKRTRDIEQESIASESFLPTAYDSNLFIPNFTLPVSPDEKEANWNIALAHRVNGESEVKVAFGRVDVLNSTYAIEIDFLEKWQEGIGQSLHYGDATRRIPCLALILREGRGSLDKNKDIILYIDKLCREKGITLIILTSL